MADHHAPTEAADHDADAYVHGMMPIEEQAATWALVQGLFKWGSLAIAASLLFLVIWFQPGGSFFGGLIAGVVVAVAGWFFLKGGKAASH
ncbi:MAG: aa3-type cytochrome c oxidase subunit IV [Alphaproteobacteria bacterium]|nr:aa3-type cytochrome c oxidase subunit IV [Alphaproteobacteria bacterium]MBU2379798.1 aa3-type cytochrome c oxidase subunit IV [Alphaproteobacteria bacterium]